MSKRFLLDFFALLGAGVITDRVPAFAAFGALKMTRVFRVSNIIARLNITEGFKALLNLIKLTLYLTLWLHSLGCFFYIILLINKDEFAEDGLSLQWYPPLDFVNYVDSLILSDAYDFYEKYVTMLYHAVLMLGSNEIGPVNNEEMLFATAGLVASSFLNALIFGDMAGLVAVVQSDDNK